MIDGRTAVRAIAVCAVALAGIGVGYIEGQRSAPDSGAVGSVAETWNDDNTDAEER